MASRILGMGDMLTLIESAARLRREKAEELAQKMRENSFDFNDFIEQRSSDGYGPTGRSNQNDPRNESSPWNRKRQGRSKRC